MFPRKCDSGIPKALPRECLRIPGNSRYPNKETENSNAKQKADPQSENSVKFVLGIPTGHFGVIFPWRMRMAKLDLLSMEMHLLTKDDHSRKRDVPGYPSKRNTCVTMVLVWTSMGHSQNCAFSLRVGAQKGTPYAPYPMSISCHMVGFVGFCWSLPVVGNFLACTYWQARDWDVSTVCKLGAL